MEVLRTFFSNVHTFLITWHWPKKRARYAKGGVIPDPPAGSSDRIPAMLDAPPSYVMARPVSSLRGVKRNADRSWECLMCGAKFMPAYGTNQTRQATEWLSAHRCGG